MDTERTHAADDGSPSGHAEETEEEVSPAGPDLSAPVPSTGGPSGLGAPSNLGPLHAAPASLGPRHEDLGPPAGGFGSPGGWFGPPDAVAPRVHSYAFASMILGMTTIPGCCFWWSSLPLAVAGLVFGILALQKIQENPQIWKGREMAITGMICSTLGIALTASLVLLLWSSPPLSFLGPLFGA